MITNKIVCRIYQSILNLTFLIRNCDTVLIRFVGTFVYKLSATFTISSNVITESSIELAIYSQFFKRYATGFQV